MNPLKMNRGDDELSTPIPELCLAQELLVCSTTQPVVFDKRTQIMFSILDLESITLPGCAVLQPLHTSVPEV